MDIGVSTACFYPIHTEDTVNLVADTTAALCEVFLETISEYEDTFCDMLNARLKTHQLKAVSCHGLSGMHDPLIFSDYKRRSRDCIKMFESLVRATSILGGRFVTFHGDRTNAAEFPFDFKRFAEIMDELIDIASSHGVLLAWENVSWCQSADPLFLKRAQEYIKGDIKFTFDIKQARRAGIDPTEYIDVMGKRIVNVHINDYDDQSVCLLPGQGTVDFKKFFSRLKKYAYNGDFIIEVYGGNYREYLEIKESVLYLRNILTDIST